MSHKVSSATRTTTHCCAADFCEVNASVLCSSLHMVTVSCTFTLSHLNTGSIKTVIGDLWDQRGADERTRALVVTLRGERPCGPSLRAVIPETQTNMRETVLLLKAVRQVFTLIHKYELVELKTPQQCGIRVCVCVSVCVCTHSLCVCWAGCSSMGPRSSPEGSEWVFFVFLTWLQQPAECVWSSALCVCVCVCVCSTGGWCTKALSRWAFRFWTFSHHVRGGGALSESLSSAEDGASLIGRVTCHSR